MYKKENKYIIYDYVRDINIKYILRYIFVELENIFYRIFFNIFKPRYKNKQYQVSICAIFKNEANYLREWIEYHILVGVNHFYLYNNNSNDEFKRVLNPYIENNIVTLIDWPYSQGQMKAYLNCIDKFKEESEWIAFIDIDEFIVPNSTEKIYDFLKSYKNRPVLKLYWRLFGTSGKIDRNIDNLVIEDFTVCWKKYDEVGKCIYNTSYDFDYKFKWNKGFLHGMWGKYKGINLPPVNCFDNICQRGFEKVNNEFFPIQLNHYYTKSYNEYILKCSRGDAYFENNHHNLEAFFRHEKLCCSQDLNIYKYLILLKQKLNLI